MTKKEGAARLGRGLAALLGDRAPELAHIGGNQKSESGTLPVDLLTPGPFQPRSVIDPDHLAELAASIRSRGVLQPLLVRPDPDRPGHYQIIAGERRWRAAQMAELHLVPVHIRNLLDIDAMAAAMVENLQRADLNPMEEAEGLQRLLENYDITQENLATALGKSRVHITNMLRLLNLPPRTAEYLRQGQITAGHARALLNHPQPEEAVQEVIRLELNVRQTELLTRQARKKADTPQKEKSGNPAMTDLRHLEEELGRHLGLRAKISFNGKGGSLKISYKSLEQFEDLLRLLKA